ncbi:MAG: amino acid ABC transporter substrate-binding protein [Rhizobiaceae bacterium]|nr:amino acid ABC transporter substrate-binding protein [Rhizobiaceae bacterium]
MKQLFERRGVLRLAASAAIAYGIGGATASHAQDRSSVKIGYAVSKTGVNAAGAGVTTIPNYKLWVDDVNKAGGLKLPDGSQLPIEITEYDDRSAAEEAVRAIERLATQDKVDFILPPWGTGFNLAIAPLMDRLGYPQLAVTAVTDKAPEFAARWKKSFWLLGGGSDYAKSLAGVMATARDAGTINNKVAMISVADGFGIDLVNGARPALTEAGFELAYDKTYPLGTTDFGTLVNEAQASGADTFIAFSYPPGSFALTKQAQVVSFNPKVFYLGVGVAFPIYPKMNDGNVEGVMSLGGVDTGSEEIASYFERHTALNGQPPDSWASAVTYASLQMLQQAIERKGLDRDAVSQELSSGEFDTILGTIRMEDNQLRTLWWTGQWQDGKFVAIAPADRDGAGEAVIPKPAWK